MLNHYDLNRLYNLLLENKELTTKNLNECGYNSNDINKLIDKGILRRIKRGYYSFLKDEKLFLYGEKLLEEKEYEKADKCFLKCYELNPFNYDACIKVLLSSISKKEYELSFRCIDTLFAFEIPNYRADANLYIFLLNNIITLPDKYKNYIKGMGIDEICIDQTDTRYKSIYLQNKVRNAIFDMQFTYAIKMLDDILLEQGYASCTNKIVRHLLVQVLMVIEKEKDELLNMINENNYIEIMQYFEEKNKKTKLSISNYYSMELCKKIINVKETRKIPNKCEVKGENNIFEAINCNDFELAFKLREQYNEEHNIKSSENLMSILLSDIMDLIYEISLNEKQKAKEENDLIKETKKEEIKENVKFADVIELLLNNDLDNLFEVLSSYLSYINKKEYEFLMVNLIKLDTLKKDKAYTNSAVTLTYITKDNFTFDVSNYIEEFYLSLSKNHFEEAKIYLDIIVNSNEFKDNNNFINNLSNALSDKVKQEENTKVEKYEDSMDNTQNKNTEGSLNNKPISEKVYEPRDREKEFIEAKCQKLLEEKGAILLKPMDNKKRKKIHKTIRNYPNIVSFNIGEGNEKRIVLRYVEKQTGYIDFKGLTEKACEFYKQGNYDSCIETNLQLLQFGSPKAVLYSALGLAYMKKFNIDLAIDYFTIATYMSKQKENGKIDYTGLIEELKYGIDEENYKPEFKMNEKEFENDINNFYGINNIAEITEYIIETGIDVESACLHFGLTNEQIDTVYLIYAKEYYSQCLYDKGDEFLKQFERSKNKTKLTIKIYEEVRKNKKFYFNREKGTSYQLSLTIKPKK